MMKQVLLLLLFLAYGLTLSVSESKSGPPVPHAADPSFTVGYIQMKSAANCSYRVVLTTSCTSPKFTNDQIGIVFGDAYGNQVYAPKLGDPVSKTFEQCSSDTFQIDGACASKICYVYLYRSGANENNTWKPESLKIFGIDTKPINFDFNTSIPNETWFGYNLCKFPIAPPPPHFDPFPPTTPPPPPPPFHPFHPTTPPPPPPPPTTTPPPPPPPPPPHSSSYKVVTPKWIIYVVLGFVLSFYV
ncbi:PREDICTED: probable inactive serine/threonine-protein kinase slob2 isoform X5 [Lupinus angustifolius]|uniref:probable inactive serine/threonine-protein kinase slob2 isoform X5 n=1 Tax=Lupinus angustifolius TaxID=3871 RepID=UPI00092E87FE|nr:PREDICTED: probable inactive serine/threonine-protein kinase slob2 isoform X5 [Lupinus angustifolius]